MTHAVLFDLGGTLYDYGTFASVDRENLHALVRSTGLEAAPGEIGKAYRDSMKQVFAHYLSLPYYLHRDLFRDAAAGLLERLGGELSDAHYNAHQARVQKGHERDFVLRDGVIDTLEKLRALGLNLGIVSNIDNDQLDYLTDVAQLKPHFDWMVSSEGTRSCKPDAGIYRAALELAGCEPDQALFVGDTLRQDVAGANAMGIPSVLLWHREDIEPELDAIQPNHVIRHIPDLLRLVD